MLNDPVDVRFKYSNRDNNIIIQSTRQEKLENVFKKLKQKTNENLDFYIFLYGGKQINKNSKDTLFEINKTDKEIQILIVPFSDIKNEKSFKKSKYIICPKCQKNSIIKFENYKIILEECDNNHITSNIFFEDFEKTQLINQSKIECENCNIPRSYILANDFYKCFTCNQNICQKCKKEHHINHSIFNYDLINYTMCNEHKNNYEYFCKNCHKNICSKCKSNHEKHEMIHFENLIPQDYDIEKDWSIIFSVFKNEINGIKNMLDIIVKNIELYFKIVNDIKDNYNNNKNINYQIYQSMNNINNFNKDIIKEMKNIIFEKQINDKIYKLFQIYNKMIRKDIIQNSFENNESIIDNEKMSEITIDYLNNNNNQIQLFGEEFMINNKDKCIIKYNNQNYYFQKNYDKLLLNINNKKFRIKLQISNEITDLSYMFKNCSSLIELPDINKLNTEKITNMSYMFYGCSSLTYLPRISNWKTSNVTNMSYMFYNCKSLENLPDISNWNTENVYNMNFMFFNCSKLKAFPEINKWKTNKMKGAFCMFIGCNANILPDISDWNNQNKNKDINKNVENNQNIINNQPFMANNLYQNFPFYGNMINLMKNKNYNLPLIDFKNEIKNNNNINNYNYINDNNKKLENINNLKISNNSQRKYNYDGNMTAGPVNDDKNENQNNIINVNKKDEKRESNKKVDEFISVNKKKNNNNKEKNKNKSSKKIKTKNNESFFLEGIIPGIPGLKRCGTMKYQYFETSNEKTENNSNKRHNSGTINIIKKNK